MAGFGASYKLKELKNGHKTDVYEKNSYIGGHATSFHSDDGFIFDDGPHISFTKNKRIQEIFAENVGGRFEKLIASANNYWKGHWIKHPAQCNLYGLPSDLIVDVICDFVGAGQNQTENVSNYKEWLYASLGKTFAETFPMVYGKKYHTVDAEKMDIDWLGPRIYRPELREVLNGAFKPSTPDVHYIKDFRYPTDNGFVNYFSGFSQMADIHLDHKVTEIDTSENAIYFENGKRIEYDKLVSSIPLPEVVKLIRNTPEEVHDAVEKLACTNCVIVNFGVGREDLSEAIWTYFYDEDISFSRISFPHLMSPNNTPDGCGSVQCEVYFSKKYKPMKRRVEEVIKKARHDLVRTGVLKDKDEIIHESYSYAPYANVIFDLERKSAVKVVHDYLDNIGVHYCGRFGEWGYHWTDESFESGEKAVVNALDE